MMIWCASSGTAAAAVATGARVANQDWTPVWTPRWASTHISAAHPNDQKTALALCSPGASAIARPPAPLPSWGTVAAAAPAAMRRKNAWEAAPMRGQVVHVAHIGSAACSSGSVSFTRHATPSSLKLLRVCSPSRLLWSVLVIQVRAERFPHSQQQSLIAGWEDCNCAAETVRET